MLAIPTMAKQPLGPSFTSTDTDRGADLRGPRIGIHLSAILEKKRKDSSIWMSAHVEWVGASSQKWR
jgi:hypothetical protein